MTAQRGEPATQPCGCRSGSIYVHDYGCAKYAQRGDSAQDSFERVPEVERQVEIELTMRVELPVSDVWPDGLPDVVDAEAVIAAAEQSGSANRFISDWGIDTFGAEIVAHLNGRAARGWLR